MKKILPYLLVALLLATSALAGTAYRYTDSVTTIRGDAVGGASVYVYQANTTTKVTLYSGPHSGFTQQSNPVSTDGYGRFTFFVEPGTYDLYVYGSNITPYTLQDVRVFSDAGYTYNVLDYGAIPDDGNDDTAAFQAAVNAAEADTSGLVIIPDGRFVIADSVAINAGNITIQGAGIGATEVGWFDGNGAGGDGSNGTYIFFVNSAQNVTFRDMSLSNGPSEDIGNTNNPNAGGIISASGSTGIRLESCRLYEIGGSHGFVVERCGDVTVDNCSFYMISYSGMMVYDSCYNIKVTRSTFDTINGTAIGYNRYLFATGADELYSADNTNLYFVRDLMVDGCTFKNNTCWEGVDTHGGDRIRFTNNFITNCYIGINAICAVSGSDDYVLAPSMNDLLIDGNTIDASGAAQVWYGIIVRGHTADSEPWNAENIKVTNNTIRGYGGTSKAGYSHDNSGAITAYNLRNVEISGNHIDEFAQTGIMLYAKLSGARIVDNTIYSAYADTAFHRYDDRVAGVTVRSATEMTNILIERNRLRDDAGDWDFGIYGWTGTGTAGVSIKANEYDDSTSGWDGRFSSVAKTWFFGTYNVLDYGAVAGDSGDDTSAFQSTVAAAISAGGGVVEVPDGTFKVANLKVRGDNVTIKMSSAAVIDCDSTAYAAINVDASERFAMIGGKLTGPGELVSTSNGVLIDSCYAARFEDVEVEEFRNGIRATNQTTHTLYSGLYMHDIKFTGLWPHSGDIVTGCRFEDIGTLSTHHGIYIDQSSSDIVLSGNYYKDISGAGVQIYSPTEGFSDISCTGEVFERCGVGYIIAGTPAVRINVSGAVIDSCQNLSSSETITGVGIQLIGTAKNVSIQAIVSYPDSLAFNSNVNLSDSTFDISAVGSGLDGIRFYGKDCTGSFSVDDCAAIGFYMGAGMRNNLLVKARGNASNGIYLSGNSKRNLLNVISTKNLVGVGLAAGSDSNVVYGAAGANSSSQLGNSGTGNTTTGLVTW